MHLCNLFNNLRLLGGPKAILSPNQNQPQFLVQEPYVFYCSALLYENVGLCKFLVILVFYYEQ